jgi:hypothetical protein
MVPVLIVSAIWDLLGVYSDPLLRSSWRRAVGCLGWSRALIPVVIYSAVLIAFFIRGALPFRPNGRCNSLRKGSTDNS